MMLNAEMSDPNSIPFHIGFEDIALHIKSAEEENTAESSEEEYEEENEYVIMNRIVERAA
jgi:hypothetical protein